jgi:CRP/FNR family cyclic AMP-dependent transcriptional regulator
MLLAMVDDRISALKAVPLFNDVSDKDLLRILDIAKEVSHPDDSTVVEEDSSAVGFHLILKGTADILVGGKHVGTFGPGDYFGEMSLVDGRPRSASVIAHDGLSTLVIPSWNFDGLMRQHPDMMRAMLIVLSDRVRRLEASPRC